ncbi:DUF3991 domain-containing protein [Lactobacillus sp. ESL0791]|uniref:DUF3991 domain-containing protein n=1 Tax=Lactobacillus sp. ESL0791 TaxID=2983234 RepID=UPI0023F75A45|nr:DUF3991 domain-containing protein [Lactobacillus sp. ESL0791]MDF7639767.1 DUF3991 domain-containing protein [Lactobacillus sp. ESL0791]
MTKKEIDRNSWENQLYNASIPDLCAAVGYDLKDEGHQLRGVEHDSLVITKAKNAYIKNSDGVHGVGGWAFAKNIILEDADDYLSHSDLMDKMHEIAQKANLVAFNHEQYQTTRVPYVYRADQIVPDLTIAKKYLSEQRKISPDLVDWLHKHDRLDQDRMGNIVFKRLNPVTGVIMGASRQGTKIDFDKYPKRGTFKGIDKNSTPNSVWSFDVGKPENIRIFEAPIDAMSYYQIAPDRIHNTRFIALDGLKDHVAAQ